MLFFESLAASSIYQTFKQTLAQHLNEPTQIALGYSGGLDSELMAACLALYSKEFLEHNYLLIHVHHGLSEQANEFAQHCQNRSNFYSLPLEVRHVDLVKKQRHSIEACAREARYRVFREVLSSNALLLTAHHANDQLETLILSLKRGSGVQGMMGIQPVCPFDDTRILLRPFLNFSREQLSLLASQLELVYVEDQTNMDVSFDRNFIRHQIIPQLQKRWPQIEKTTARSMKILQQEKELLHSFVQEKLQAFVDSNRSFDLVMLEKEPLELQKQLFRAYLKFYHLKMPSDAKLSEIFEQLLQAKDDAKVCIHINENQIRRYQQRAYITKIDEKPLESLTFNIDKLDTYIPNIDMFIRSEITSSGFGIDLSKLTGSLTLQFGLPSSFVCEPHNRVHRRPLKKVWQEQKVPPWLRARIPMLFQDDKLVAAVGYWIEKPYVNTNKSPSLNITLMPSKTVNI